MVGCQPYPYKGEDKTKQQNKPNVSRCWSRQRVVVDKIVIVIPFDNVKFTLLGITKNVYGFQSKYAIQMEIVNKIKVLCKCLKLISNACSTKYLLSDNIEHKENSFYFLKKSCVIR